MGKTVLITLHGMGFQQPPIGGAPGYADWLHESLSEGLGDLLGDDPQRERDQRGVNGPVYVQSSWPPDSHKHEAGLARLGSWDPTGKLEVDGSRAPLTDGEQPIAHVALVYSHLEDQRSRLGSLADMSARAALSLGHYTSLAGAVRLAFADLAALHEQQTPITHAGTPSLRVRSDIALRGGRAAALVRKAEKKVGADRGGTGFISTLRQLEDDVATYICRNDLRDRVRGFVREALLRLLFRPDVDALVVNAHSQGTVAAYDVLRELPEAALGKVRALVTAGSPLRKYVDLFCWGTEIGNIHAIPVWVNYYDPRDPVADRLAPPQDWQPGSRKKFAEDKTLFEWVDAVAGTVAPVAIDDQEVNNVANSSGGGLQAHNYWDNVSEFIPPLADLVRRVAEEAPRLMAAEVAARPW